MGEWQTEQGLPVCHGTSNATFGCFKRSAEFLLFISVFECWPAAVWNTRPLACLKNLLAVDSKVDASKRVKTLISWAGSDFKVPFGHTEGSFIIATTHRFRGQILTIISS